MPEIIGSCITFKNELVSHVVAGTGAGLGICAVSGLKFRIQFFVNDSNFYFVLHSEVILLVLILIEKRKRRQYNKNNKAEIMRKDEVMPC